MPSWTTAKKSTESRPCTIWHGPLSGRFFLSDNEIYNLEGQELWSLKPYFYVGQCDSHPSRELSETIWTRRRYHERVSCSFQFYLVDWLGGLWRRWLGFVAQKWCCWECWALSSTIRFVKSNLQNLHHLWHHPLLMMMLWCCYYSHEEVVNMIFLYCDDVCKIVFCSLHYTQLRFPPSTNSFRIWKMATFGVASKCFFL